MLQALSVASEEGVLPKDVEVHDWLGNERVTDQRRTCSKIIRRLVSVFVHSRSKFPHGRHESIASPCSMTF